MTPRPLALAEVFAAEEAPPRKPPRRVNRPKNLTLTPSAHEALNALAARPGSPGASAEASAAILARAEALMDPPIRRTSPDEAPRRVAVASPASRREMLRA